MSDRPPGDDGLPADDVASIRRVIAEAGSIAVERRRFLATYAYILVRLARADGQVNDDELVRMEAAIANVGRVAPAQGALLVASASRMISLYGATEDYVVAREFVRLSSPQERQRLIRDCITVGTVDGPMTDAEVTEVGEIGRELGLDADDIAGIRAQVDPTWPGRAGSAGAER